MARTGASILVLGRNLSVPGIINNSDSFELVIARSVFATKQSRFYGLKNRDCFVAALLAMTE